ncbi:hypothetical protein C8R44DRAFT_877861 [Mycena epipterygia]|nr:hypothetical protein C8R44DRAFT_877861 [Mycena epipterygia]
MEPGSARLYYCARPVLLTFQPRWLFGSLRAERFYASTCYSEDLGTPRANGNIDAELESGLGCRLLIGMARTVATLDIWHGGHDNDDDDTSKADTHAKYVQSSLASIWTRIWIAIGTQYHDNDLLPLAAAPRFLHQRCSPPDALFHRTRHKLELNTLTPDSRLVSAALRGRDVIPPVSLRESASPRAGLVKSGIASQAHAHQTAHSPRTLQSTKAVDAALCLTFGYRTPTKRRFQTDIDRTRRHLRRDGRA